MDSTSITLLVRLRQQGQPDAWDRFVRLYTPLLRAWARAPRYGLQEADADDLVQDVLADLVRTLPNFALDPRRRFRAWLRGVFDHKWADLLRRKGRLPAGGKALSGVAAPAEADPGEAEEQRLLVRRALELMRAEFAPSTWKACWLTVAEGCPAAAVAAALGLSENAVYIARCRVLRRLREDLAGLLD